MKNFFEILALAKTLSYNGYWLSQTMHRELIDFYKLLNGFVDYSPNYEHNHEVDQMIANARKVDQARRIVVSIYYKDMENMHDLGQFFNEKRQNPIVLGPRFDFE